MFSPWNYFLTFKEHSFSNLTAVRNIHLTAVKISLLLYSNNNIKLQYLEMLGLFVNFDNHHKYFKKTN